MTKNIYDTVVLLDGIVLETEVEVFLGIHLTPFPASLGKKGKEIPRYVSEWASTVGIDYFFNKTQLIIDSSAVSEFNSDHIEQLCQVLSLACNFGIQIASFVSVRKDEKPFSMVPYTGPPVCYMQHDPVKDSEIEEAKRLYELLDSLDPDVRRKLHISINRWIKSHAKQNAMFNKMLDFEIPPEDIATSLTTSDVDKMIDLGIAFESLYLDGVSKLSHHLSNRASEYLAESQDEQEELKETFKEIYSWRSKAVHDGRLPTQNVKIGEKSYVPLELIIQAQNLCRRSILRIVEDPHPRVILNLDKEYLKPFLENGCKLRKSETFPIKCRFQLVNGPDCQLHYAIIPPDGISKKGYVQEVWIEYVTESVELDNQDYDIMTPVHHSRHRIQEFILDSDDSIKLLPNPDEIVVKYFKETPCSP